VISCNLLSAYSSGTQRAELLYLKQQFELKRDYGEALRQSRKLAYIGSAGVLGGFTANVVTLALLIDWKHGSSVASVAVTVAVGVGAIIAYLAGSLFLCMHTGATRALTECRCRLVDTNHLHFSKLWLPALDGVAPRHAEAPASFIAGMRWASARAAPLTRTRTTEPRS